MSKRLLILLTILTTLPITTFAQHTEQMLAIHHDNGKTTFFALEILDSITYSTYDLDHQPYEEKVTLELHLPDTLVRMAIAGIDSLCVVTLPSHCPDGHHPHAIDLGLPSGKKWACCNVGAHMPEGYGSYFGWGEVEEKDTYTWQTYPYAFYVDMDEMYVCNDIGDDISGTGYDAAFVNWGSPWCMPSKKDYQELINNCIYKRTTYHNVEGWFFSGPNNNSIFIPAAGWYAPAFHSDVANYWSSSSTPDPRKNRYASFLTIIMLGSYTLCNVVDNDRYTGKTVRAVTP